MMSILLVILVAYYFFHMSIFKVADVLFVTPSKPLFGKIISYFFNSIVLLLLCYFRPDEGIIMCIYGFLLFTEFRLIYKETTIKALFATVCFSVSMFAIRLIVFCIISLINYTPIYELLKFSKTSMRLSAFIFIVCTILIEIIFRLASKHYIQIIGSSLENIKFVTYTLLIMYSFLIFNSGNLYVRGEFPVFTLGQLKIGISALIGFSAILVYGYLLSRLMLFAARSDVVKSQISVISQEQQQLNVMAYHDAALDCYTRDYGIRHLDAVMKDKEAKFSVCFFDLDGLKYVNDEFGHNEGDIYLKMVVNVLKNVFGTNTLCRMGGDEFMAVLENQDYFSAAQYAVKAFEAVEVMSKMAVRPYNMSISYGVVAISSVKRLSRDQLLEVADKRMYTFKRKYKKARL